MEGSLSPFVRKVVAQVASKPKPTFTPPTQVCLEDWWLSKPSDGDGIAVSGRPIHISKNDDARSTFDFASPTRKLASREFHSTKIVKRHGGTLVETSVGVLISLCGFINKSRTQRNGFSSEIYKNFICGFPFNWDDFTAECVDVKLGSNENILDSFTPAASDLFKGAELHDLVLSLTDEEMGLFIEANSMPKLKPQREHEAEVQCPEPNSTSGDGKDCLTSDDSSAEISLKQIMKMEQCSISAPSSLIDTDILTCDNKITDASQNKKRSASTHVSDVEPSISSPLIAGLHSNDTMASKKQRPEFKKSFKAQPCNTSE